MILKYNSCVQVASVSVLATPTAIFGAPKNVGGAQCSVTIPLHNLTGFLYLVAVPLGGKQVDNITAPDAAFMTNYGTQWSSSDKVATLNIGDDCQIFGMTSTGTFSAYPTVWN